MASVGSYESNAEAQVEVLVKGPAPEVGVGFEVQFEGDVATVTSLDGYEISEDGITSVHTLSLGPEDVFQVRMTATDISAASDWTSNTLPARPDAPENPSYRFTASAIATVDDQMEVSHDGMAWTDILTGLSSDTAYDVYLRHASTADSFASEPLQMSIRTAAEPDEETTVIGDPDGSITTTTTKPIEDGTQTTVTHTDPEGNFAGSEVTEKTVTDAVSGGKLEATVVETTDADGVTTVTSDVTITSEDVTIQNPFFLFDF